MFITLNRRGAVQVALFTIVAIASSFAAAQTPTNLAPTNLGSGQDISHGIALADFNGDGHVDTAINNYGSGSIYFNDGHGGMQLQGGTQLFMGWGHSSYFGYDVDAADFDNDGDMDLLSASGEGADLFTNDGQGNFTKAWTFQYQAVVRAFAIGDLDNNGYLDIVVAASGSNKVYLNTAGYFTFGGEFQIVNDDTTGLTLGDFDGDGDLDCVVANTAPPSFPTPMVIPSPCAIYLNNGSGSFTFSADIVGEASNVSAADFDGDSDLDLMFGNDGYPTEVWLNDGSAGFTKLGDLGAGSSATAIALADVDKDGDTDAILVNWVQNRIYLNDGAGNFTASTNLAAGGNWCWDIEVADLNGDGELDFGIAAGGSSSTPQQNILFLSTGSSGTSSGLQGFGGGGGGGCVASAGSVWVLALLPALLLFVRRRRTS
ncbi:MAG: FG-GAP repeat domain-containing protein [Planctomycetota bacterium]|jgi:hypothetical protein